MQKKSSNNVTPLLYHKIIWIFETRSCWLCNWKCVYLTLHVFLVPKTCVCVSVSVRLSASVSVSASASVCMHACVCACVHFAEGCEWSCNFIAINLAEECWRIYSSTGNPLEVDWCWAIAGQHWPSTSPLPKCFLGYMPSYLVHVQSCSVGMEWLAEWMDSILVYCCICLCFSSF